MKTKLYTAVCIAAAAALSSAAFAQSANNPPPHVPLQKNIGQARPDIVPSLIVLNSRGATMQGGKLVLTGVATNSIIFADRPVRSAGHALTTHLLEEWGPNSGDDGFAKNPPNATVSAFSKDGSGVRDAVVVLKTPKLEGDKLTFDVDVLEGELTGADGPASIFIDIIGLPRTPLSFAGVARRTAYRGAWYGASTPGAALAEAFQVDRVIDRARCQPYLTGLSFTRQLSVLDLAADSAGAWTTRVGGTYAISTGPHIVTLSWARAIVEAFPDLDGLRYNSRFAGSPCIALFAPASAAMPERPKLSLPLTHPALAARIAGAAKRVGYSVV